jgi:hypothetical protein
VEHPKLAVFSVGAATIFALCCSAAARASVEFCPAVASVPAPIGAPFGAASTRYAYDLTAQTPRGVDANLIADTDNGWYRWNVSAISLTTVKRYAHDPPGYHLPPSLPYTIASSPTLSVTFPVPVVVRHAWIESALAVGDPSLQWNGKNLAPCEVPAFESAQDKTPDPDVAPSPAALAPAVASAAQAPFDIGYCALKFADSTVIRPARPQYDGWGDPSVYGYAATIATALDPSGHLIDAWVYAGSGSAAFDRAALRAARDSTYVGAVSYCRPVSSRYLFIASAIPGGNP